MSYVVDWMRLADIPAVVEIEQESFGDAWPSGSFQRELLHNRLAHYLVVRELTDRPEGAEIVEARFAETAGEECRIMPAEGDVIGHLGMWLLFDESHLTTIAVRGARRREGLAELLLIAAAE